MWLDTTYNCFHWAYSSFNRFREWLFRNIWLDVDDYYEYNQEWKRHLDEITHPILPLLNHSDCDGVLSLEDQKSIIKWWKMILADLKESNSDLEEKLKAFIEGCELALAEWEVVEFA